jgi:rod shape determining protein RodA
VRTGRDATDLITLAHLVVLGLISVVAVTSATIGSSGDFLSSSGFRQLVYLGIGIGLYLVVQRIDYHDWADMWVLLYAAGVLALLALPWLARPISGARSWLELGPLRIQPSEPMKVITALAVAAFLAEARDKLSLVRLVQLGALVGLPMALIVLQPDMGTALTFVPLFLGVAWLAGIRGKVLISLALIGALAVPILWFGVLEPYQKERVLTVFDPERDPSGSGYQVIQSRIAVGSGQITGKGLFRGSQSRLDFLPARETDFVLAVIAEETGFVGVLVVLGVYLSLLLRTLQTAAISQDPLGAYLAVGVASLWAGQIFINTGMVAGILPTIGVPLPALSAGGSSLVATFLAFAIVGSVRVRRFVNL